MEWSPGNKQKSKVIVVVVVVVVVVLVVVVSTVALLKPATPGRNIICNMSVFFTGFQWMFFSVVMK